MKSLLLDHDVWDLIVDAAGNIACATEPYSRAQDVACACRLFLGELWYDINKGVPYLSDILGKWPPLPLVRSRLVKAALTVPGVVSAQAFITSVQGRNLAGYMQFVDVSGQTNTVTF